MKDLFRSLSVRLLAIFLLLGGLFVFGAYQALIWVYNSDDIRGLISGHLSLHVYYVKQDIGTPPDIDKAIAITERVPVDIRILGPDIDWSSHAGFPSLKALEFGPSPAFSDERGAWVDELSGVEFAYHDRHRYLKMRSGEYDIVVATPPIGEQRSGPDLKFVIVGLGLFALTAGYLAVQWLFRPIRAIRTGARHIGRGNFDHRITDIRKDQLGDLAQAINKLAGDVEGMLDAKRALLLGLSHELRTPLSRMRLGIEFLDKEDDREKLKAEISEMEKIVVTLLEAERLNSTHAALARTRVQVRELVEDLVDDFFARDRERIELEFRTPALKADIDDARVTLMLKNLIGNALRYSHAEDGPVEVTVDADSTELVFIVRDHGPGIPSEQIEHIGEPFYRPDPSRARHTGGTGLGLYLAMLVARAHGGQLKLCQVEGNGACFEVRLPLG
ncbi:MAG: HAMP domain-containing sensor histidine kinase [Pseudomonadota bacterium]